MAESNLISSGTLVILIGFALLFAGFFIQNKGKAKVEGGGIFFIGPFPIGFASSERAFYILIVVSVIFFLFFILLSYLNR